MAKNTFGGYNPQLRHKLGKKNKEFLYGLRVPLSMFFILITLVGTLESKAQKQPERRRLVPIESGDTVSTMHRIEDILLDKTAPKRKVKEGKPEFIVTDYGFSNKQNPERSFIVFNFPGKEKSTLMSSIYSKLTSMFNSPSDVIKKIGDNIISVEGYSSNLFNYNGYSCDILYTLIIEFKDGKIKYNHPVINKIYVDTRIMGKMNLESSKTFDIIATNRNQDRVALHFNGLVIELNSAVKESEDW